MVLTWSEAMHDAGLTSAMSMLFAEPNGGVLFGFNALAFGQDTDEWTVIMSDTGAGGVNGPGPWFLNWNQGDDLVQTLVGGNVVPTLTVEVTFAP